MPAAIGPSVDFLAGSVAPAPLPPSSSPPRPPFGVFLGRKAFALARISLWLFHALCAAYFVAAGVLYRALTTTQLAGMLQLYSLTIHRKYFSAIGFAHYGVAALFLRYVVHSLYKLLPTRLTKKLRVKTPTLSSLHAKSARFTTGSLPARTVSAVGHSRPWRALRLLYQLVLSPSGFFGVESRHFEVLFLVREIVETILQTNQAYQMSRLLPRAGFNRIYVTLLVLNSWSTPFFYRFGGRNRAQQRLLSLLCDIVLDFISAVGVPVWLALDYGADYDVVGEDFPLQFWYNDTWIVRFMNDVPLMLLGDWLGAFSRLLFSISLLSTLQDIRELLKPMETGITPNVHDSTTANANAKPDPHEPRTATRTTSGTKTPLAKRHARLVYWAHVTMVLFGDAILGVHIYAETRPTPTACVLVVRPWLTTEPACALIELNCLTTPTLSGDRTDFDAITRPIDALSLAHVVVRHCPHVEFTARLQAFQNLIGIKLYNATIDAWPMEAALQHVYHPRMRFFYVVHTRFPDAALPAGLMAHGFPPALRDIEISGSNLASLPDDLHERWPPKLTLYLEFSAFASYPLVLTKLNPRMLVLGGNPMTTLPPEALLLPDAYTVALTGSALEALPADGIDAAAVYTMWIFADSTRIAALPAWMDEAFLTRTTVYLGGSPFCVDVLGNETSTERAALLAERPYVEQLVDCFELEPERWPFYPQYLEVRDDEGAAEVAT